MVILGYFKAKNIIISAATILEVRRRVYCLSSVILAYVLDLEEYCRLKIMKFGPIRVLASIYSLKLCYGIYDYNFFILISIYNILVLSRRSR